MVQHSRVQFSCVNHSLESCELAILRKSFFFRHLRFWNQKRQNGSKKTEWTPKKTQLNQKRKKDPKQTEWTFSHADKSILTFYRYLISGSDPKYHIMCSFFNHEPNLNN